MPVAWDVLEIAKLLRVLENRLVVAPSPVHEGPVIVPPGPVVSSI